MSAAVRVEAELMINYVAGSPVTADSTLDVLEDPAGEPILFTIGNAPDGGGRALWITWRDPTVRTGWRQAATGPGGDVRHVAVSQADTGEVILAVVVTAADGGDAIHVTPAFQPSGEAWDHLTWSPRPAPTPQTIKGLLFGARRALTDDPQAPSGAPSLLAEIEGADGGVRRWFVPVAPSDTVGWTAYPQAVDLPAVHGMALGWHQPGRIPRRGVFTLYTDNDGQTAVDFSSVPEADVGALGPRADLLNEPGRVLHAALAAPSGAISVSALPAPDAPHAATHLYFGGPDGLWRLRDGALEFIARIDNVTTLIAREDADRIALWAVDGQQDLHYLSGPRRGAPAWSTPLVLYRNVVAIAARRNRRRAANELFVTTSVGGRIGYLWQDPQTTTWNQAEVLLPALDVVQDVRAYTSVISLLDADGAPRPGLTVELRASAWTRLQINGYWRTMDVGTPLTVQADASGQITLLDAVADLGTAVFEVHHPEHDEPIVVDPGLALRRRLQQRLDDGDLAGWTRADGTPLIPAGADPARVAQAQEALQTLLTAGEALPPDGSPAPDPTPAEAEGDCRGDVLHALHTAGEAVYHYVVEPVVDAVQSAVRFVVDLAVGTVQFVVRTLTDVLQGVGWIFQQIGVLLDDLVELVGFLFAWDDILDTQRVFAHLAVESMTGLGATLHASSAAIGAAFDRAIAAIRAAEADVAGLPDTPLDDGAAAAGAQATDEDTSVHDWLRYSPAGTFPTYQLTHGGALDGEGPDSDPPDPLQATLQDALDLVSALLGDALAGAQQVVTDLVDLAEGGRLTIKNVAVVVLGDAASTLLAALRDLLVGLAAIAADLTAAIVDHVLTQTIEIPVISGLFSLITDKQPLTVVNAIALLAAIPATLAYKLVAGRAPFAAGTDGLDTAEFGALLPRLGRHARAHLSAKVAAEPDRSCVARYSQIGGLMGLATDTLGAVLTPTALYLEKLHGPASRRLHLVGNLAATADLIGLAGSFPFDEDEASWVLDLVQWIGGGLLTVVGFIGSLSAWARRGKEEATPITSLLGHGESSLMVLNAVLDLSLALGSYALEILEDMDDRAYHSLFWDTEKLLGNLINGTCEGFEAFSAITDQPEILLATSAGNGVAIWLDLMRGLAAIRGDYLFQAH